MTASGQIMITICDGIATVRLANAERRNAISTCMWRELAAFATDIGTQDHVRVVIVRGEGDVAFSGGADITDFEAGRSSAEQAKNYDDLVEATCRKFEAIPQPTLALIKGACMGAGASLAASCDLRLAAVDAFFAVPAARLGLGYDPRGVARFIRVFGSNGTRQLLFTADRLPAARAYALGAVHTLAPTLELDETADALARRIAGNAPLTVKAAKVALRALTVEREPDLMMLAGALASAADASADYIEGRHAFAEKRTPRFRGN